MTPSLTQLLIILVIVALIFGTKKLKSMGSDIGGAVKGFKDSVNDDKDKEDSPREITGETIEGEADTENKTDKDSEQQKS